LFFMTSACSSFSLWRQFFNLSRTVNDELDCACVLCTHRTAFSLSTKSTEIISYPDVLGLPDPDTLVKGTDPDPSIIKQK
jgi:hypothetical protein